MSHYRNQTPHILSLGELNVLVCNIYALHGSDSGLWLFFPLLSNLLRVVNGILRASDVAYLRTHERIDIDD